MRFLESNSATGLAGAHDCVDALQDLVRDVDLACLQVEENKDFSSDAIRRRRVEICEKAMTKLANFKAFRVAEMALIVRYQSAGATERSRFTTVADT
jgi:hypothetical protein